MELIWIAKIFRNCTLSGKGILLPFYSRNRKGCLHLRKTLFREKEQLPEDVNAWLRIGGIFVEGRSSRGSVGCLHA